MQKLFISLILLLSASSSFAAEEKKAVDKAEFLLNTCSAFVPESRDMVIDYADLLALDKRIPRNNSLYLYDKKSISKDWVIIDITRSETQIPNTLKLPIHALKVKQYLYGKKMLILGDGVNYNALEHEVTQLKEHLSKQVKIYFGGIEHWNESSLFTNKVFSISAAEYVNESQLGDWSYIYNKEDLQSVISRANEVSFDSLTRYLIMDEQLISELEIPNVYQYKFFLLKGGKATLAQLSVDQTRMLSASQERALRARCKGNNNV